MEFFERLLAVKYFINHEMNHLRELESSVDCALSESQECGANDHLDQAVNGLLSSCDSLEVMNKTLSQDVNSILSLFKPKIIWHPNTKEMLQMFYVEGNSPWSIWLSYEPSLDIDDLLKILENRYNQGLLKKLENPQVGDYVLCCDKKIVFRAQIVDINNMRIKVINVDKYNIKFTKLDNCYKMDRDLCEVQAHSIQCCLIEDRRYEKLWNKDLSQLFQNLLKESRLTIRIDEEIQSIPPLFLVEMYAFNEALEVETNLSHWITKRLLPELEVLPPDDTFDDVLGHLSDQALDPFDFLSDLVQFNDSENSSLELGRDQSNLRERPVDNAVDCASSSVHSLSLTDKPRNRLAHLLEPQADDNLSTGANLHLLDHSDCLIYKDPSLTANSLGFHYSHMNASPTGSPKANGMNNESLVDSYYDQIGYEDSVIPGNYIPTDEKRICTFYVKRGYCWKPGCTKEHTKVEDDRWTGDSDALYKDTINCLNLPEVYSTLILKVTYIVTSSMFYALLPEKYSDTGEGHETLTLLNENINSSESKSAFKLLETPPCLGQLLLAYCSAKSLWLRAVVKDICDNDIIQVFFVDYGATEELPLAKCRDMSPEFRHLPYQAVYCTLSNAVLVHSKETEAKSFLQSLLLDREIVVKVKYSDDIDNRLEVIAFANDYNVNELMIEKGFHEPYLRKSLKKQ